MKKRILFVAFKKYNSILEGGGLANARSVDMARKIMGDENVDVFYMNDENEHSALPRLIRSACLLPLGYWNGVTPGKVNRILEMCQNYDTVFICTSVLGMVARRLRQTGYKGRIVCFFHNVESEYYKARVPKYFPLKEVIVRCAARNDRFCIECADLRVALTERDADKLQTEYGRAVDYVVPVSFADKCADMEFDKEAYTSVRPLCLFIGSNFPANTEGVLWFVQHVLPHVDIDFRVVGKGMGELKRHSCMKDVEVVGDVPDLTPYFLSADFMVLPVFSGSGMKVKTCEALMYGKNIIGSAETFVGYDLDTHKCGMQCDTTQQFIDALNFFASHPVKRFNNYSRNVFLEKYSDSRVEELFREIFGKQSHYPLPAQGNIESE